MPPAFSLPRVRPVSIANPRQFVDELQKLVGDNRCWCPDQRRRGGSSGPAEPGRDHRRSGRSTVASRRCGTRRPSGPSLLAAAEGQVRSAAEQYSWSRVDALAGSASYLHVTSGLEASSFVVAPQSPIGCYAVQSKEMTALADSFLRRPVQELSSHAGDRRRRRHSPRRDLPGQVGRPVGHRPGQIRAPRLAAAIAECGSQHVPGSPDPPTGYVRA